MTSSRRRECSSVRPIDRLIDTASGTGEAQTVKEVSKKPLAKIALAITLMVVAVGSVVYWWYNAQLSSYKTYSDFGFSFDCPEGMIVQERIFEMIQTEDGLYMSPHNNDNAGAINGGLKRNDVIVERIDISWRQMEPRTLTIEDADRFFVWIEEKPALMPVPEVTVVSRGEFGERAFAGHRMIYQYFVVDVEGSIYNGIWLGWYCETSQRKYDVFVETVEEEVSPIVERYLDSFVCHQPGYDYSPHETYSRFDVSFEYLKDCHHLAEYGIEDGEQVIDRADYDLGMIEYHLRYPNKELQRLFREVTWLIAWTKLEEDIYVTEDVLDMWFDWEGHTFERGELVETTTKTGHRILYQDYVLTACWDVFTGVSLLFEDETATGVYGVWYCDDSQRVFELYLTLTTEEDPITIFEDFLDTFTCHKQS